jgi:hypothetical protein
MSTGGNAEGYGAPTPQGSFIGKASRPDDVTLYSKVQSEKTLTENNGRSLTRTVQTVRAVAFVSAIKKLMNVYII